MIIANPRFSTDEDEISVDNLLAGFEILMSLRETTVRQWLNYLWRPANDDR